MQHRHLDVPGFRLAAIDDIIARGGFADRIERGLAAERDGAVRGKPSRIVAARTGDESLINHDVRRTRLELRSTGCRLDDGGL